MAKPDKLLAPPTENGFSHPERATSTYQSFDTFVLPKASQRKYTTQYADLYFVRLALLKRQVEEVAHQRWGDFEVAGEKARRVEKVLDVRQGELCWVVGTVFMDMRLKPNILDDLAKESWIVAPPQREKYIGSDGKDQIILEDESGRLELTGKLLRKVSLCTGCIVAVIGTENSDGAFDIFEILSADLPAQPERWATTMQPDRPNSKGSKIAIVSGLEIDGITGAPITQNLLLEYLLGETGDATAHHISRLILAGNSLANASPIPSRDPHDKKTTKQYSKDPDCFNDSPPDLLDRFLSTLLPSLPITIIPGTTDPASVALPQQPLHSAFFAKSREYMRAPDSAEPSWFDSVTNPWEAEIDGWSVLATGGQTLNDMYKYVKNGDRLSMMESFLRWRNIAPTAPDTLWTYPFQENDPFILRKCPHVFIAGDQPRFDTTTIEGKDGQSVRLIAVPSFRKTGVMVLLDLETLDVETVLFEAFEDRDVVGTTAGANDG